MTDKNNIKVNQPLAIASGSWEAVKSFAKRVPICGDLVVGLEKYQDSVKEQTRTQLLNYLENKVNYLTEGLQEYFNTKEGRLFFMKIMETALNAEYIDKQEIFVNALLNSSKKNVSEDEKSRFIDLIRHLSKVSLNVLSVIYEMYDKQLEDRTSSSQVIVREVVTKTYQKFEYAPELTDSAIRELRNIGLFSNVIRWRKNTSSDSISEETYIPGGDAIVYTLYTRRFIEFIKQNQKFWGHET